MKQAIMKTDSVERFRTTDIKVLPTQEEQEATTGQQKRFLNIDETAEQTGLSVHFIRQGIRQGWIPHIRCGNKAMINIRKFLEILDEQSVAVNQ